MPLSESEQKLAKLIERRHDALLEDLKLHVNLPTGPGGGAIDETRERFASRLTRIGSDFELIPGDPKPDWLWGSAPGGSVPVTGVCRRTKGRDGFKPVLVAGHLDTVHHVDSEFRELSIRPDGKTATGPGCVDMKGGLVIAVAALEAIEEAGIDASWTFSMNADEETGTFHSDRALRAEAEKHAFGLALEPALPDGSLATVRGGSGSFMIETLGKSSHVGRAFTEGVSAVNELARTLLKIESMADPNNGRVLSVGPLEGNRAPNAVPDRARAWGNARYPEKHVGDAIENELMELVTPVDHLPSVRVHTAFNRPAKPLLPETEQLALAARAVAEDLGQSLPFATTGGVCDGNNLQAAGLPTIDTLGVRGGGLHTTDEWIDLTSLVERCQLLAVLIVRLSGGV